VSVSGDTVNISVTIGDPGNNATGGWAYSTSPLGAVGAAHGGTAVSSGTTAQITGVSDGSYTLYYGLIDSSGNVVVKGSTEYAVGLAANLISTWNFDSGNANDSVGSNNASSSTADYATASGRTYASLDPADQLVYPNTDFKFTTQDFTYSFWMKPASTQDSYGMVFSIYGAVSHTGYYFVQDSTNNNRYWFRGNGGSSWQPYSSTVDIAAGVWTHVTIVRSGNTATVYTNGSQAYQDTNAVASTISYGSSNPNLIFGRS